MQTLSSQLLNKWILTHKMLCCSQIKAVSHDDTPLANMKVHLFEGERWSARLLQNLTTNNEGIATFSMSTAEFKRDINLLVRTK